MNFKSAAIFESVLQCQNDRSPTLQQLLTILKKLEAASDKSSTDLTSTTGINLVSYCRFCLDKCLLISDYTQIGNLYMFMSMQNRNIQNRKRARPSNRPYLKGTVRNLHVTYQNSDKLKSSLKCIFLEAQSTKAVKSIFYWKSYEISYWSSESLTGQGQNPKVLRAQDSILICNLLFQKLQCNFKVMSGRITTGVTTVFTADVKIQKSATSARTM